MAGYTPYVRANKRRPHYLEEPDDQENFSVRSDRSYRSRSNPSSTLGTPQDDIGYPRPLVLNIKKAREDYYSSMNSIDNGKFEGGDPTLPLEKHKGFENSYDSENDGEFVERRGIPSEATKRRYLSIGVQWVSLLSENLLSHPFVVLRRQCQVHNGSNYYHLHPLYLIPSIIHLHQRQGVTTLWKGLGSCLLVRGLSMGFEDILSKLTGWPKEVDSRTGMRRLGQHVILKSISIAVVMPYYAASLVETVQSDIASEKPGIFDVFREGSIRLLYWKYPQKGRMLPIWALIGPSVSVGITKYLFGLIIKGISTRIMRARSKTKDEALEMQYADAYSNIISIVTTEVIFFPFETILHRIQLQGTRTIVDNLDNGFSVVPILTNYQDAIDCYRTTLATEGVSGLYKGLGAVMLQLAAQVAVIKLTKWVVTKLGERISSRPPAKVLQYYNLDRAIAASNSATLSPNLSSNGSEINVPELYNELYNKNR